MVGGDPFAILLYSLLVEDPSGMLDDNKGCPEVPRRPLQHTKLGTRFERVPQINEADSALITMSWNQSPANRPSFPEILDEMIESVRDFLMPRADEAEVRRYIEKMRADQ
jgi:hypothetical protein